MNRITTFAVLCMAFVLPYPGFSQCQQPFRVLHYTETTGYDHNTRNFSQAMFEALGADLGFSVSSDNNGAMFSSLDSLEQFALVVFSNTSGNTGLDSAQRANLEAYMLNGGGFLGIHAAGDTYRHSAANGNNTGDWDWYAEHLTGASVRLGPSHTSWSLVDTLFRVNVPHPITDSLPDPWVKQEEFYYWENGYLDTAFTQILKVNQTGNNSYDSARMMAQIRELPGGGRAFYTALGHAPVNYTSDQQFRTLIREALMWVAEPGLASTPLATLQANLNACAASGSVLAIPADSVNTYSFLWNTGDTTAEVFGLQSGTYSVTITDSAGCVWSDSVSLQVNSGLSLQMTILDSIDCFGGSNGAVQLSASGGVGPYQFSWANGDTALTRSALPAGTYFAVVTDSAGCSVTDSVTLTAPAPLQANIHIIDSINCSGGINASIELTGNGGVGGFQVFWGNGDTTTIRSALPAGQYFGGVTDANGCVASDSVLITEPSPLILTSTITQPISCFGSSDGEITLSASGGAGSFSYFWPNGDTSQVRSALPAGTYVPTVTDANGCVTSDSVVLMAPAAMTFTASITQPISCFGSSDGEITLSASGGAGSFSYFWPNGDTAQVRTALPAGTYVPTVTDANGCVASDSVVLMAPAAITFTATSSQPISCFGGSDGEITLSASGGAGSFSYFWPNGDTAQVRSALPAGTYVPTVTDANGCVASDSVVLMAPAAITFTASISQPISCFGGSDGEITLSASGGAGSFSYFWPNGDTSQVRTALPAGTYVPTVTDANGCVTSDSVVLMAPEAITFSASITQPISCFGSSDGEITLSAIGGAGSFSYSWPNGDTSQVRSALPAGIYVPTVTDANGCVTSDSVVLMAPAAITFTATISQPISCFGSSDGEITLSASGGAGSFSYFWPNGDTAQVRSALPAGTYVPTVTDANGCVASDSVVLMAPAAIAFTATISQPISCFGSSDGEITLSASGGTSPYQFQWNDGSTGSIRSGLSAGTYYPLLADANGCTASDSVVISAPDSMSLTVMNLTPAAGGAQNGAFDLQVAGGISPYQLQSASGSPNEVPLINADSLFQVSNLSNGEYVLMVTDANGCEKLLEIILEGSDGLTGHLPVVRFVVSVDPIAESILVEADLETREPVTIRLTDLRGRTLHSLTPAPGTTITGTIPAHLLPRGMYLVELLSETGFARKRILLR